jgi:chromosome segregation ATPase
MRYGNDTLGIIDQHITTARARTDEASTRLAQLNQRLADIRAETNQAFRRLARFRLDELAATRVMAHLDATDQKILALLDQRASAVRETEARLQETLQHQAQLQERRRQAAKNRDDLFKQLDDAAADVRAVLGRREDYRDQEKRAAEAQERVARAQDKAAQAETDRVEKGRPYENDPLFMYLWNRRFLSPQYKARGPIRALDGWVAALIGYADARGNYHMLTQLPVHLHTHAAQQAALAEAEDQKLRQMEAAAFAAAGLTQRRQALDESQEAVEKLEAQIGAAEREHETLLQAKTALAAGSDTFSRDAVALQVAEIQDDSLTQLYLEARMTAKADDDLIVNQIRDLKAQEEKISAEIREVQAEADRSRQGFQELEALRRRFRQSQYDSGHSYFPGGFDLGALLGMLMGGATSGGDVWDRIQREQKFQRPRTPENFGGGIFPPGLGRGGRSGGFGGGGFRSGGGFGGGGFRTGGRF